MYEEVLDADRCPYNVCSISFALARTFIGQHHYAKGMANAMTAGYGLFDGNHMIGALVFQNASSEAARATVFGGDYRPHITDLHRLVILDVTPRNAESWFIAQCLRRLKKAKPHIWGILSFADPSAGHCGTIYQATNAVYSGLTAAGKPIYVDGDGRQRHSRQCGKNVGVAEAARRGWTAKANSPKHRYCLLTPDHRRHRKELNGLLRLENLPYPRPQSTNNGKATH